MIRKCPAFPGLCTIFLFVLLCATPTAAQSSNAIPRITQVIEETNLVVLHGNTYPLARPEFDQGVAPNSLPMRRMLLVLQRSQEQEASLDQLLDEQQDNSSANYHHWLTPQQFGAQFGPADADIQAITTWLHSHGFEVNGASKGKIIIEFSGTAGQVQDAFHTAIHKFLVNGEQRYANASDPIIPAALVPVVTGVRSLHNFPARPMNYFAGFYHRDKDSGKIVPDKASPNPMFNAGNGANLLGPYDLATIYDVSPLWSGTTPIDGTGQTIAIVGETDINPADWSSFWNMFGVASPKGTLNIIHDGPAPGIVGDEPEADIDTQWSSAVAKGATIDLVVSQSTEATLGVDLSAEFIVDNNLAPVMSESYGVCELFIGTAGNAYYNSLWQQASAQGITVFVASGDQGSAACDRDQPGAQFGLAVSGFESTPYNVSVGGTDFNDLTTSATYWNPTNNANQANAKGYIPEMTWNDTCTNSEVFSFFGTTGAEQTCNNINAQGDGLLFVAGGSGGSSNCTSSNGATQGSCTGGYAKPPWQVAPGMPPGSNRNVPDVSLFASNGFNGTGYIICQSDVTGSCHLTSGSEISAFGGTSVSSPAFAGIMALINQKTGERQGNANYVFYKMAATASNTCDSSTVPITGANNCIFYDIPTGSTIAMPCVGGSPNCSTKTAGDQFGVLNGYDAGTGYDLATGLGSVNVENLVNQWSTYAGQFKGTKFSSFILGPPATITHGQSIPVAATVVPQSGTGTPTGTITLIANTGSSPNNQQAAQQLLTLANGSLPANSNTTLLPGGAGYSVTAHYSGDSTFAPSDSSAFTVTVNPEASKVQPAIPTFNLTNGQEISANATSLPYGSSYLLRANVTNSSANPCAANGIEQYGCPTGTVSLTDTFNGSTSSIDAGTYSLNNEGYTEDQTVSLLGGQHSIVASYSGDKSFNSSNNSATPDVVTVMPETTITGDESGLTGTITIGTSVVALFQTNTVNPGFYSVPPSGTYAFFDGTTKLASTVINSFTGVIYPFPNSPYVYDTLSANIQFIVPGPPGPHTFSAAYSGDSNYSSSVSGPLNLYVAYATSTKVTSSAVTIQHGSSVTFTATVTPNPTGGPVPTGTVLFTCNLSGIIGNFVTLVGGQAQVSTSSLPGGDLFIEALYSGDTNYEPSHDTVQETVLLLGTTTAVSTSNAAIQEGTNVTLTAQVNPVKSGGPAITGSVQFYSNGGGTDPNLPIGNAVTLTGGQAQVTATAIPAGTQLAVAVYSGDVNYAASTASTAEVVTPAPTFRVTANPTTVAISKPGGKGSTMLTFTAMNGFSGTIPLSPTLCTGMPLETTCNFSVSSVVLSNNAMSVTTTVTFQTRAPSSAPPQGGGRPLGWGAWRLYGIIAVIFALCMGTVYRKERRGWSVALTVLAIVSLVAIGSCGGGGGGGGVHNPGTPVGLDPGVVINFNVAGVTPAPTVNISLSVQ